jgi:hypothetical protein
MLTHLWLPTATQENLTVRMWVVAELGSSHTGGVDRARSVSEDQCSNCSADHRTCCHMKRVNSSLKFCFTCALPEPRREQRKHVLLEVCAPIFFFFLEIAFLEGKQYTNAMSSGWTPCQSKTDYSNNSSSWNFKSKRQTPVLWVTLLSVIKEDEIQWQLQCERRRRLYFMFFSDKTEMQMSNAR